MEFQRDAKRIRQENGQDQKESGIKKEAAPQEEERKMMLAM